MVSIFKRYLIKQVILATLVVMGMMLVLVLITTLMGEFQDMGRGDYNFLQAFYYVLLRLPHNLYQFAPMLILLGGIIGLGVLTSHQELMVIRSSGFSLRHIVTAVSYSALLLIMLIMLIGEGLAPQWDHKAAIRKQNAENNGQAMITTSGLWLHQGDNFFHIDHVIDKKHLEGVRRYQFNSQHELLASYYAKTMDLQKGKWLLREVVKTRFNAQQGTQSSHLAEETWNFALNPSLLSVGSIEAEEMSLPALAKFSRHLIENGLHAAPFELAYWQRLLQPLAILVMLFLAIPFVLASPRSSARGLRLFFGILCGFAFYVSNAFLGQLSIIFQLPSFLAAALPILLFAGIGYLLLLRVS